MEGLNAVSGVRNMDNGANAVGGSQQNEGMDQRLQEIKRRIKELLAQGSNGGEGGDELAKLREEEKKLSAQMSQGAEGDQGAQSDQGGRQGQIQMPETQGSGKVGG
ncbi:hypothetical protein [Pseudomonas cedrina]|uniref:hypothetical protein n=1 Tax=Pseudomonas cedrina TaxID=651740 RepID=UPI002787A5A4|nr:hypothetical protein [Pseudomonas cedrina]MDQ0650372.1 di/tripeptidase [Pseudomonas cedrina]